MLRDHHVLVERDCTVVRRHGARPVHDTGRVGRVETPLTPPSERRQWSERELQSVVVDRRTPQREPRRRRKHVIDRDRMTIGPTPTTARCRGSARPAADDPLVVPHRVTGRCPRRRARRGPSHGHGALARRSRREVDGQVDRDRVLRPDFGHPISADWTTRPSTATSTLARSHARSRNHCRFVMRTRPRTGAPTRATATGRARLRCSHIAGFGRRSGHTRPSQQKLASCRRSPKSPPYANRHFPARLRSRPGGGCPTPRQAQRYLLAQAVIPELPDEAALQRRRTSRRRRSTRRDNRSSYPWRASTRRGSPVDRWAQSRRRVDGSGAGPPAAISIAQISGYIGHSTVGGRVAALPIGHDRALVVHGAVRIAVADPRRRARRAPRRSHSRCRATTSPRTDGSCRVRPCGRHAPSTVCGSADRAPAKS